MEDGSLESEFEFISFKITELNFSMERILSLLSNTGVLNPKLFEYGIAIRPPVYFKSKNIYVCGVALKLHMNRPEENKVNPTNTDNVEPPEIKPPILKLEASIEGTFRTKGRFSRDLENNLVRIQAPAILFPFLRAAIGSFFSNAGFGPVMIPLINMNKVAESQLKESEIVTIEQD